MRADETARGFGCYRQSHRTHRRGHRHADRPAGPTGNRARQTTRPARGFLLVPLGDLRDQQEIARAKQLVLPVVSKKNIPKMYVLMDGVQVPVVAAETVDRKSVV